MTSGNDSEIANLRERLTELEDERASVLERLGVLEHLPKHSDDNVDQAGRITANSPSAAKVALFRSLFAGRSDVYAMRWENAKSGRSGYSPACSNEWVAGICNKPQIKCSECLRQAFIPLSANVIEQHLRGNNGKRSGEIVVGTYPLLPDDTCFFLQRTLTAKRGLLMLSPILLRAAKRTFRQRSNAPDREMAATPGDSSPNLSPPSVRVVLADEVYIDRSAFPPAMVTLLVRIAAFQNPEYYRVQSDETSDVWEAAHYLMCCASYQYLLGVKVQRGNRKSSVC